MDCDTIIDQKKMDEEEQEPSNEQNIANEQQDTENELLPKLYDEIKETDTSENGVENHDDFPGTPTSWNMFAQASHGGNDTISDIVSDAKRTPSQAPTFGSGPSEKQVGLSPMFNTFSSNRESNDHRNSNGQKPTRMTSSSLGDSSPLRRIQCFSPPSKSVFASFISSPMTMEMKKSPPRRSSNSAGVTASPDSGAHTRRSSNGAGVTASPARRRRRPSTGAHTNNHNSIFGDTAPHAPNTSNLGGSPKPSSPPKPASARTDDRVEKSNQPTPMPVLLPPPNGPPLFTYPPAEEVNNGDIPTVMEHRSSSASEINSIKCSKLTNSPPVPALLKESLPFSPPIPTIAKAQKNALNAQAQQAQEKRESMNSMNSGVVFQESHPRRNDLSIDTLRLTPAQIGTHGADRLPQITATAAAADAAAAVDEFSFGMKNDFLVAEQVVEVDFSAEPLEERLIHKDIKRRASAYVDFQKLFTEGRPFDAHLWESHLPKALGETLPAAYEASLKAVLAFAQHTPNFGQNPDIMNLILNCLLDSRSVGKAKFQALMTPIVLKLCMGLTLDKVRTVIMNQLKKWETTKQSVGAFKIQMTFGFTLIKSILNEFGLDGFVPSEGYLYQLFKYVGDSDRNLREACYAVLVELHTWGVDVDQFQGLKQLPEAQKKELSKRFEKAEKRTTSVPPMAATKGVAAGGGTAGTSRDDPPDDSEPVDPFKLLSRPWSFESMNEMTKWTDKRNHLVALCDVCEGRNLIVTEKLNSTAQSLMNMVNEVSNVPLVQEAARLLGLFAKGLQAEFKYGKECVKAFLSKLHDKSIWKPNVFGGINFFNLWYSVSGVTVAEEIRKRVKSPGSHYAQKEACALIVRLLNHRTVSGELDEIKKIAAVSIPFLASPCDDTLLDIRTIATRALAFVGVKSQTPSYEILAILPSTRRAAFEKAWKEEGGKRESIGVTCCDRRSRSARVSRSHSPRRKRSLSRILSQPKVKSGSLSRSDTERIVGDIFPRDVLMSIHKKKVSGETIRNIIKWWEKWQTEILPIADHILEYLSEKTKFSDLRPCIQKSYMDFIQHIPKFCAPRIKEKRILMFILPPLIDKLGDRNSKVGEDIAIILVEFSQIIGTSLLLEYCVQQKVLRSETLYFAGKMLVQSGIANCGIHTCLELVRIAALQGTHKGQAARRFGAMCKACHPHIGLILQTMVPADAYAKMHAQQLEPRLLEVLPRLKDSEYHLLEPYLSKINLRTICHEAIDNVPSFRSVPPGIRHSYRPPSRPPPNKARSQPNSRPRTPTGGAGGGGGGRSTFRVTTPRNGDTGSHTNNMGNNKASTPRTQYNSQFAKTFPPPERVVAARSASPVRPRRRTGAGNEEIALDLPARDEKEPDEIKHPRRTDSRTGRTCSHDYSHIPGMRPPSRSVERTVGKTRKGSCRSEDTGVSEAPQSKYHIMWRTNLSIEDKEKRLQERHYWGPQDIPKEYLDILKDSFAYFVYSDTSSMWGDHNVMLEAIKSWKVVFEIDLPNVILVLDLVLKYLTWLVERSFSAKILSATLGAFETLLEALKASGYEWSDRELEIGLPIMLDKLGHSTNLSSIKKMSIKCVDEMIKQAGLDRTLPLLLKGLQGKNRKSLECILGIMAEIMKDFTSPLINYANADRFIRPLIEDSNTRKQATLCMRQIYRLWDVDTRERLRKSLNTRAFNSINSVTPDPSPAVTPKNSEAETSRNDNEPKTISLTDILNGFQDSRRWVDYCDFIVEVLEKNREYSEVVMEMILNNLNGGLTEEGVKKIAPVLQAGVMHLDVFSEQTLRMTFETLLGMMRMSKFGGLILDCGDTWRDFLHQICQNIAQSLSKIKGTKMLPIVEQYLLEATKVKEDFETAVRPVRSPKKALDPMRQILLDCTAIGTIELDDQTYFQACRRISNALAEGKTESRLNAVIEVIPEALKIAFDRKAVKIATWAADLIDVVMQCMDKNDNSLVTHCPERCLRDVLRELLRTLNWLQWTHPKDESGERTGQDWKGFTNKVNQATVCTLFAISTLENGTFVYSILLKFGLFERRTIGENLITKCIRKMNKNLRVEPSHVETWCRLLRDFSDCLARSCPQEYIVQESINHASMLYKALCVNNEGVTTTLLQMLTSLTPCAQVHLRRIFHKQKQNNRHENED